MATEDKGPVSSEEKIRMPERKGKRKQVNSLARFFKVWATPLSIFIAAVTLLWSVYQFNAQQQSDSQKAVQQQTANQQQVLDQQHQTTLDTYLDRMSDLLLTSHLAASKPGDEVRALAEARTYTAVRNLDGARKGTLVRFLLEAGLISRRQPIISVPYADLSGVIFIGADLSGANLEGTNLSGANFTGADLSEAIFANADLSGANLSGAIFTGADLSGANLEGTNLSGVYASSIPDTCACYQPSLLNGGATLSMADLHGATYNTKPIQVKDVQGNPLTLEPTQWPQGFDPMSAGLNCVDC
jgi:Pentapeptide repeats (8 copies)